MAEYCAVRTCDICRENVARKRGLFWETYKPYRKLDFEIPCNREYGKRAILCEDCYDKLVQEVLK